MTFVTFGCRVNQVESASLLRSGRGAGYVQAAPGEAAALVVVNTCAVTGESERQARQAIRRAVRAHPGARVVVTGCYAQRDPKALAEIPGVSLVVGNADKTCLFAILESATVPPPGGVDARYMSTGAGGCPPMLLDADAFTLYPTVADTPIESPAADTSGRARAYLQVQNGCDAGCTFCVIPSLRGRGRSTPLERVLAQAGRLLEQGFEELVLTGINLGAYGRDLAEAVTLSDLLEQILALPNLGRLRLSSIAPQDLDAHFLRHLVEHPRLCPHLHLSVQSGDDLILKRMHRSCTREQVLATIAAVRDRRPGIVLGADLIVGFPTESEEAFANTLNLLREGEIALPHTFRYSDRPGTPAARIPPHLHVPAAVIRDRAERLRRQGEAILHDLLQRQVGQEAEVLIEEVAHGLAHGKTGGFLPLTFPTDDATCVGRLTRVRVTGVDASGGGLLGELPG